MAINATYRFARRVVIAVVGFTILLVGVVMLIAPGPAIVVIPLGLAVLGIEFAWARMWLKRVRQRISRFGADDRGERAEAHRERYR